MQFHQSPTIYPGAVYLRTTNLEQSSQFYREILGLQILSEIEETITFTVNGKDPILVITEPTNVIPREPRLAGLFHFALLLPSRKELGKMLIHLIQNEVNIGASDHHVSEALYLDDPDGNGIEIYCDREYTDWEWIGQEVQMTTVPLDADAVIAAAGDERFTKMPAETVMGHIHLQVSDLAESEAFYSKIGFQTMAKMQRAIFMSHNKYHHHLGMNTWAGENADEPSSQAAGLIAYTLIYPDEATLKSALESIQISSDVRTIVDPSGIRVHLAVGE